MKRFLNIPWSLLWGIFILILTLTPGNFFPEVPTFMDLFEPDKLIHIFIFGMFVILIIRDAIRLKRYSVNFVIAGALLIGILSGALTEILQMFIPGRAGSPYDFIADTVGCFLGWGFYHFFFKRKYS